MTSANRYVFDVQVKRSVGAFPVTYKPGPKKSLQQAVNAVGVILGCSIKLPNPAADV